MDLNKIFKSVVYKTLAGVDLVIGVSHQHEINGTQPLRDFFETDERISGTITWHLFSDNDETITQVGDFTFYDARARSFERTGRSEWRLYYSGEFFERATIGDLLILVKTVTNDIHGLVFQNGSNWQRIAAKLFNLRDISIDAAQLTKDELSKNEIEYSKRRIIDELGIEYELSFSENEESIAKRLLDEANKSGIPFPRTRTVSDFARKQVKEDGKFLDDILVAWLDKEERIFYAMERILVQKKLADGFDSVDDFISYSLQVQNRRKSRMGYSFQNHLEVIFQKNGLKFESQKITEGKNKPDFIFPGIKEYKDEGYPSERLAMLASKSSCKERWAQILTEAARIPDKHLCTLDQTITTDQIRKISSEHIKLVIPESLQATYTDEQKRGIWKLSNFVDYIKTLQIM